MKMEHKDYEERTKELQNQLRTLELFLEDYENLQDDLRRFNMVARREIMKTQKILSDFSRTYSEKSKEELR